MCPFSSLKVETLHAFSHFVDKSGLTSFLMSVTNLAKMNISRKTLTEISKNGLKIVPEEHNY